MTVRQHKILPWRDGDTQGADPNKIRYLPHKDGRATDDFLAWGWAARDEVSTVVGSREICHDKAEVEGKPCLCCRVEGIYLLVKSRLSVRFGRSRAGPMTLNGSYTKHCCGSSISRMRHDWKSEGRHATFFPSFLCRISCSARNRLLPNRPTRENGGYLPV